MNPYTLYPLRYAARRYKKPPQITAIHEGSTHEKRGAIRSLSTPRLASELNGICCGFSISNRLLIIFGDDIKNRKNLIAIVTLCQQRDENLLGHNEVEKCSELFVIECL